MHGCTVTSADDTLKVAAMIWVSPSRNLKSLKKTYLSDEIRIELINLVLLIRKIYCQLKANLCLQMRFIAKLSPISSSSWAELVLMSIYTPTHPPGCHPEK
jgi:hypothetical protein